MNEPWIDADTTVVFFTDEQVGASVSVYLSHEGGSIEVDGWTVPEESWLKVECSLLDDNTRIYGQREEAGHTLLVDVDVEPWPFEPERFDVYGYLIVDGEGEIWIDLEMPRE